MVRTTTGGGLGAAGSGEGGGGEGGRLGFSGLGLGGGGGLGSGVLGLGGGGGEGSRLTVATPRLKSIVQCWRQAASRWTCPPRPSIAMLPASTPKSSPQPAGA